MASTWEIAVCLAALGSGLVAGLCFAFGSFILPAFDRLGAAPAIRAMQAINSSILRSSAMFVWLGTAVLGFSIPWFAELAQDRTLTLLAAVSYGVGALLVTGRGNVPLNEELDRVDPDDPAAEQAWLCYRRLWTRWNAIRTILFGLALIGFSLAA